RGDHPGAPALRARRPGGQRRRLGGRHAVLRHRGPAPRPLQRADRAARRGRSRVPGVGPLRPDDVARGARPLGAGRPCVRGGARRRRAPHAGVRPGPADLRADADAVRADPARPRRRRGAGRRRARAAGRAGGGGAMSDTTPSSSQGGDPRPEAEVPTPPRGVRAPGPVEPWHGPVPPVHGPVGGAGPAGPQPPGQPAGLGQPDPYGRPAAHRLPPRAPAPPAPPPPQPHEVWQRPPAAPTPPRRVRWSTVLQVVALVLGLVGAAWVSTDYLRTQWPLAWPRDPVPVSADGTATLAGVTVSLVEARDLGDSPSLPGTDWQPPAGFHAWRV